MQEVEQRMEQLPRHEEHEEKTQVRCIAWFLETKARCGFLIRHHECVVLQL